MKTFKIISILSVVTFIGYWIWRWYKLVTSETWQGYLTLFITIGVIVLLFKLAYLYANWNHKRQQKTTRQRSAQRIAAYEKEVEEDRKAKYDAEAATFNVAHDNLLGRLAITRVYEVPIQPEEKEIRESKVKNEESEADKLRQADNAGIDVCWDCETIHPTRCRAYNKDCTECIEIMCDPKHSNDGYCESCESDYWLNEQDAY